MKQSGQVVEIIPSRFYWLCDKQPPTRSKTQILCTDETLSYTSYSTDFGPVDISMIWRYCELIKSHLDSSRNILYHFTSIIPSKRSNSALLVCAYQVIVLNRSPDQAWQPFSEISRFLPYRDACFDSVKFELYIIDCLRALQKAISLNWFDLSTFDNEEYIKFSQSSYGAFNWIVPENILAFPAPSNTRGLAGLTPEEYSEIFESLQVNAVVKVNQANYDGIRFKKKGIRHYEIASYEGNIPSESTIRQFIEICRKEKSLAVNCHNGLGKSITLIGCYVIKHFNFSGREFIAWARMCRPGSVVGNQQPFLCSYYDDLYARIVRVRHNSTYKDLTIEPDVQEGFPLNRFQNYSVRSLGNTAGIAPATYKTKYNQLVKIDPLMLKLYSKNQQKGE